METGTIEITLKGQNFGEIVSLAQKLVAEADAYTTTEATPTKKRKAAPPVEVEEPIDEETETLEATDEDESFLEEETPPPKKSAKKLTEKDVNTAAMKHAKAHTKKETMKILTGKFKVKSILELKPEQYATVIKALAV